MIHARHNNTPEGTNVIQLSKCEFTGCIVGYNTYKHRVVFDLYGKTIARTFRYDVNTGNLIKEKVRDNAKAQASASLWT